MDKRALPKSEEHKRKIAEGIKKAWADPEKRRNIENSLLSSWRNPKRKHQSSWSWSLEKREKRKIYAQDNLNRLSAKGLFYHSPTEKEALRAIAKSCKIQILNPDLKNGQ